MTSWKFNTPPSIRCPWKCDKGWVGEPEVSQEKGVWSGESQCNGCGAYAIWDFNPDRPMADQQLFVRESYEGFWEPRGD